MKKQVTLFVLFLTFGVAPLAYRAQNVLPTSGKVGIGTTTPTAQLDVLGTTRLQKVNITDTLFVDKPVTFADSLCVHKQLSVGQDVSIVGTAKMQGNATVDGSLSIKSLADVTLVTDRWLTIDPNGQVKSAGRGDLLNDLYDSPCKGSGTQTSPVWASNPGILWTGDVCAPAKVGIGTSSPNANLHVVGTAQFGQFVGIGQAHDTQNKLTVFQPSGSGNGILVTMNSTSPTQTNGVGIKTIVNNPNRKAFVIYDGINNHDVFRIMGNGSVLATEMRIKLSTNFPDYVFTPEYELRTLTELETYINEEGHLPNMPTAEEVQENGLPVGEVQTTLVEKVEELTLYLIQLQKENEALKERIIHLEKVVEPSK